VETTKSGLPIHTGTGTPEAYLVGDIYAHALGNAVRQLLFIMDGSTPGEEAVAAEVMERLKLAGDDIVRSTTTDNGEVQSSRANVDYTDAWGGITLADGRSVCPDGKGSVEIRTPEPKADIHYINPLCERGPVACEVVGLTPSYDELKEERDTARHLFKIQNDQVGKLGDYINLALTCTDPTDVQALLAEAMAPEPTEPVRRDRHDASIYSKIKNSNRGYA